MFYLSPLLITVMQAANLHAANLHAQAVAAAAEAHRAALREAETGRYRAVIAVEDEGGDGEYARVIAGPPEKSSDGYDPRILRPVSSVER